MALGRINDGSFLIDTKWAGGMSPPMTAERVLEDAKDSVAKLGKVGTFYFHFPDPSTPVEEQLAGVDEAYKAGLFTRFGLSNYQPGQVQEVYDVAKAKGYVLPTVYQGMYSPVNRKTEELLPLLRRLGISFNAYSPLAGGFLTKTRGYVQQGKGDLLRPLCMAFLIRCITMRHVLKLWMSGGRSLIRKGWGGRTWLIGGCVIIVRWGLGMA